MFFEAPPRRSGCGSEVWKVGKVKEGVFEVKTSKAEAIARFRMLQGECREALSGDKTIEFLCTKKGRISIGSPSSRYVENQASTSLTARVVEREGKTCVVWHTSFDGLNNVTKWIALGFDGVMVALALWFALFGGLSPLYALLCIVGLTVATFKLFDTSGERRNAAYDSSILVEELERRVSAVNDWHR